MLFVRQEYSGRLACSSEEMVPARGDVRDLSKWGSLAVSLPPPHYRAPDGALYLGDVRDMLAQLPAGSVHVCVTSPPYHGLRTYGVDGQIGLEPTIEAYVETLVEVFREVRRVLREDGVLFLNLGDSYWGGKGQSGYELPHEAENRRAEGLTLQRGHNVPGYLDMRPSDGRHPILKPLDLCGIPWRVAFTLQADGWWLRSDIIYHKTAPMPESMNGWRWERCRVKMKAQAVGTSPQRLGAIAGLDAKSQRNAPGGQWEGTAQWADCPGCPKCKPNGGYVLRRGAWRPTTAHEHLFMLTTSATYFCDAEAVKEPWTDNRLYDIQRALHGSPYYEGKGSDIAMMRDEGMKLPGIRPVGNPVSGRNPRSVWTIGPEPFLGAHFATFPTKLVEPCVRVSTSEAGCCPKCGAQWARMIAGQPSSFNVQVRDAKAGRASPAEGYKATQEEIDSYQGGGRSQDEGRETIGWRPTCSCGAGPAVPCTVLDPFIGSGTTAVVARKLDRHWVGIDLSEKYLAMTIKRLEAVSLPLPLAGGGHEEGRCRRP